MTNISFEFFPPKTVTAAFALQRSAKHWPVLAPQFCIRYMQPRSDPNARHHGCNETS